MNKQEFDEAVRLAQSKVDLSNVDDTVLDGCGLPNFDRKTTTIPAVAKFLRWQCAMLHGGWDEEEMNNLREIFRHKVEIVGDLCVTYQDTAGNPVSTSNCVVPDHQLAGFYIQLRSLQHIHPDTLKQLIQEKFEVVQMTPVDRTMIVRSR